jgi:hypothetical protein
LLCPGGTAGHDVCGCAICAQPDAGVIKDGGRDVVCGPMCNVYCPYGNKVDDNGCLLCSFVDLSFRQVEQHFLAVDW